MEKKDSNGSDKFIGQTKRGKLNRSRNGKPWVGEREEDPNRPSMIYVTRKFIW